MAKPIGIFDSGLGGLTVARAIHTAFPAEDLVSLGDTARVPYGTRSAATVVKYAIGCSERLRSYDIKLLVVACNTASGVALRELQGRLDIPVVGVIQPGRLRRREGDSQRAHRDPRDGGHGGIRRIRAWQFTVKTTR